MILSESLDAASRSVSRIAAEYADQVDRDGRVPEEALCALGVKAC